jgi:DNA-binding IclR family transcriptional regulator
MAHPPVNDAATERYTVPGLQRGLQLLAQFNQHTRELNGAELARRLALPRASVFRLLQTLEQMGFVERVGDSSNYRLGIAVLRLGFEFLASMDLAERGNPVLNALSATSGLSAHLVVRDGTEVVFIAKSAGNSGLLSAIQVGARLPVHATVLGRVLLGQASLAELQALYAKTPMTAFTTQTPTSVAALKKKIDEDAQQGYAVSHGGYESGISTIAAPVFDEHQAITAAVSVTVPASRIEPSRLPILVNLVQEAAVRLSRSHATQTARATAPNRLSRANPESEFA